VPLRARMTAPPCTGFFGAAFAVLSLPGAAGLKVRPAPCLRTGTIFLVLGSRSEVSAEREAIESSRAVNRRIRKLLYRFLRQSEAIALCSAVCQPNGSLPKCFRGLCFVVSMNLMESEEELKSEIERLRAENQALKKPGRGQVYLKVSEKGGLSVYGMGRFPVTLYREQWEKLLGMADEIRNFIRENDHSLKKKE
jgi:hypothetical protein